MTEFMKGRRRNACRFRRRHHEILRSVLLPAVATRGHEHAVVCTTGLAHLPKKKICFRVEVHPARPSRLALRNQQRSGNRIEILHTETSNLGIACPAEQRGLHDQPKILWAGYNESPCFHVRQESSASISNTLKRRHQFPGNIRTGHFAFGQAMVECCLQDEQVAVGGVTSPTSSLFTFWVQAVSWFRRAVVANSLCHCEICERVSFSTSLCPSKGTMLASIM